jgi:hypothetical protein
MPVVIGEVQVEPVREPQVDAATASAGAPAAPAKKDRRATLDRERARRLRAH